MTTPIKVYSNFRPIVRGKSRKVRRCIPTKSRPRVGSLLISEKRLTCVKYSPDEFRFTGVIPINRSRKIAVCAEAETQVTAYSDNYYEVNCLLQLASDAIRAHQANRRQNIFITRCLNYVTCLTVSLPWSCQTTVFISVTTVTVYHPSLFHSRLKTHVFNKSFLPQSSNHRSPLDGLYGYPACSLDLPL